MHSHIPNDVMRTNNKISTLDLRNLPCSSQAVSMYHQEGGRISDEHGFGEDPLQGDDAKASIRAQAFDDRYPSYDAIFHEVVNMNPALFKNALRFYIDVTYRLSRS
jgi:ribulose-5-phosphate 4-epimerase/fuculose-1-phosphate aldolase